VTGSGGVTGTGDATGTGDVTGRAATASAERNRRILDVMRALGPGEVVTYGDIADVAGYPKQSRLVGRLLATTDEEVPWWRVVNAAGRLVPGHEREQSAMLRDEGVEVRDGKVRRAPWGRFSR
jgi:methylated-DNA-protein-cysteine methyltransferase related protein